MKIGTQILAALLAVGAVYFYGSCMRSAGKQEAKAAYLAHAIDSTARARDSVWADSIRHIAARVPDSVTVTRIVREIKEKIPTDMQAKVDSLADALTLWEAMAHAERARGLEKDRTIDALRAQRDAALRKTAPRIRCGPAVGVGIGLTGGATAFVGAACIRG